MDSAPQPGSPSLIATIGRIVLDGIVVVLRAVGFLLAVLIGIPLLIGPLLVVGLVVLIAFVCTAPTSGVYRTALTRVYMRHKLSPLFAAVVVTLCTMMVIIVISVMGGFLDLMRSSVKRLSSDVSVKSGVQGFGHYEELAKRLEALDEVEAATPVTVGYGLLRVKRQLVDLNGKVVSVTEQVKTVEVRGIDPAGYTRVTGYESSLYWRPELFEQWRERLDELTAEARSDGDTFAAKVYQDRKGELSHFEGVDYHGAGMRFKPLDAWQPKKGPKLPAIVLGIEVDPSPYARRMRGGRYWPNGRLLQSADSARLPDSMRPQPVSLTLVPMSSKGTLIEPVLGQFIVVNETKSGLYELDNSRVYIPLDIMQSMLDMDAGEAYERPLTDAELELLALGETDGLPRKIPVPARTTQLSIKLADDIELQAGRQAVQDVVDKFLADHPNVGLLSVHTWEQQHSTLLNAVQNEKGLVTFLFAIISLVAFVMVGTVFYNIVLEKTRDIGVLRALGASRLGVANIFLGYGLSIGIVGGLLGLGLAMLIIFNINEINDLLFDRFGIAMWNPQTYYFDTIPEQINPTEATFIVIGAIMCSVLSTVIAALMAARLNPVDALRYE